MTAVSRADTILRVGNDGDCPPYAYFHTFSSFRRRPESSFCENVENGSRINAWPCAARDDDIPPSFRLKPHRAVQTNHAAIDIAVADDERHGLRELGRLAESRRVRDRSRQGLLHLRRHAIDHRRP